MLKQILLIEDESSIADNIRYSLENDGFAVQWVMLGSEAIDTLKVESIDLVILDVGLPDQSGFEVCRQIRKFSDIPIIFLTARSDEIDRVVGLEIGADDYVVKPFSPRELTARVNVILRRVNKAAEDTVGPLAVLRLLEDKRQIIYQGIELDLTTYEYGILSVLFKHPGRVYSRQQLMDAVWSSPEESFDRVVDTHIKTIRSKLRTIDPNNDFLMTHRGIGYSFRQKLK